MSKKLFITDLDGTLLTDQKTISGEDLLALRALREQNIYTAIATGRSGYSLKKTLNMLNMAEGDLLLPVDFVMISTGAGIVRISDQRVIFQRDLLHPDVQIIMAYFNREKIDYMVHRAIPHTRQFVYRSHGGENPDFQARLALYEKDGVLLDADHPGFDAVTEVLAILPGGADEKRLKTLRKDLKGFSVIHATSPLDHVSAWIEVFHPEVSKAGSGAWLAQQLDVERQNVLSVGNDYNDQDLLSWSGMSYVVNNAPDSMKSRFRTVNSNNHSGVSMALKQSGWIG